MATVDDPLMGSKNRHSETLGSVPADSPDADPVTTISPQRQEATDKTVTEEDIKSAHESNLFNSNHVD